MTLERLAAQAWALRASIEFQAEVRFARLAAEVERFDPASPVVKLFADAALEEARHAALCDELARSLGASPTQPPPPVTRASPKSRQALLCEVVAACCIAETESLATLTLLLSRMQPSRFKEVVHTIARDEVDHAQAGWAHLAREARAFDVGFLATQVVAMVDSPTVRALFAPSPPGADDEGLYAFGVVPHSHKRSIFVEVVEHVLAPGLAASHIDPAPLHRWLTQQTAPNM